MASGCSLDYSASHNGTTIDCNCAVTFSGARCNSDNSVTNTGLSSIGTKGRRAGLHLTCAAAELCWPCSLWLPVHDAVLLLLHDFGAAAARQHLCWGDLLLPANLVAVM